MRALRRGFKKEANQIVRLSRLELGLDMVAPLDPWRLSSLLEIPVIRLSSLSHAAPDAVKHFTHVEPSAFSAVTVFRNSARLIIHNDSHSRARQASDLAHELAHALLQHAPQLALDQWGCRIWPENHEWEAAWLAGALLIPEEAALSIVRRGLSVEEAAAEYAVSEAMVRFRLNVTAAYRRQAR
jgi:hypothetical protein